METRFWLISDADTERRESKKDVEQTSCSNGAPQSTTALATYITGKLVGVANVVAVEPTETDGDLGVGRHSTAGDNAKPNNMAN